MPRRRSRTEPAPTPAPAPTTPNPVQLRKWADLLLIAPLSANTLAKLAGGLADNLLTCVARAWAFSKPLLVAPAMNTAMWEHPLTASQLALLVTWGVRVVPPVVKVLACGDEGRGAMASVADIVCAVRESTPGEFLQHRHIVDWMSPDGES